MKIKSSEVLENLEMGLSTAGSIHQRDQNGRPLPFPIGDGWIKGKAVIEGDDVILRANGREVVRVERHKGDSLVLLKFVNLNFDAPEEIVDFVQQFGLLTVSGLRDSRESLQFWEQAQNSIYRFLDFLVCIQMAERDEEGAFNELAKITDGKAHQYYSGDKRNEDLIVDGFNVPDIFIKAYEEGTFGNEKSTAFIEEQKRQLLRMAKSNFAEYLRPPLSNIIPSISCEPISAKKSGNSLKSYAWKLDFKAPDLFNFLFLQLAFSAIDSKPMGLCECGKFFPKTRIDKTRCRDSCGGTIRKRSSRKNTKSSVSPYHT